VKVEPNKSPQNAPQARANRNWQGQSVCVNIDEEIMHRSITVRKERVRRSIGNETGWIEVREKIARRARGRMTYKVAVIFYADPEFWEKDKDHPEEEPYSWTEQRDFKSVAEAESWLSSHYEIQDLASYFATKGLRLQVASDLTRDCMALEVFTNNGDLAAELFYSDVDRSIAVTRVDHPISTDDFELLISTAKRLLTPENMKQASGGVKT
jgi:hypothetical protein